jgi:hypothetical protein
MKVLMSRKLNLLFILFLSIRSTFKLIWHYSGLAFIAAKATSNENEEDHPTFILWLLSIYIAAFGFASQQYENRLDRLEFRFNAEFSRFSSAEVTRQSVSYLNAILSTELPPEPDIFTPSTIFSSITRKSIPMFSIQDLGYLKDRITDITYDDLFRSGMALCPKFNSEAFKSLTTVEVLTAYYELIKEVAPRVNPDSISLKFFNETAHGFFGKDCELVRIVDINRFNRYQQHYTRLEVEYVSNASELNNIFARHSILWFPSLYQLRNSRIGFSLVYLDGDGEILSSDLSFSAIINDSVKVISKPINDEVRLDGNLLFFTDLRTLSLDCETLKNNHLSEWSLHKVENCKGYPVYPNYESLINAFEKNSSIEEVKKYFLHHHDGLPLITVNGIVQ